MTPATLVVLAHSRPDNIPRIVEAALDVPWFSDVLIWNQGNSVIPVRASWPEKARIWHSPENLWLFGRYAAAQIAKTELIASQDDDCVVKNWDKLRAAYDAAPNRIAAALQHGHFNGDSKRHWGDAHECLLGWGSLWRRDWIEPAFAPYLSKYGPDEVFVRKADRLFTILRCQQHTVIPADVERLPHETDGTALYHRSDHKPLTVEARRRALGLLGIPFQERDINRL